MITIISLNIIYLDSPNCEDKVNNEIIIKIGRRINLNKTKINISD
jgi:hypothetical protein